MDIGDGSLLQRLQADLNQSLWVIRIRVQPGYTMTTHYHAGPVLPVTLEGSWYYREYPDLVNAKSSYLYEPLRSVHTLTVPTDSKGVTDAWFAIHGANVNIDERGSRG